MKVKMFLSAHENVHRESLIQQNIFLKRMKYEKYILWISNFLKIYFLSSTKHFKYIRNIILEDKRRKEANI